jgi:hypothetical protein
MPDDNMAPAAADNSAPVPFTNTAAAMLGGMPPQGQPPMAVNPSDPSQSMVPSVDQQAFQAEQDRQQHMGWIGHVLDRVGGILGGDTTVRVHKDADGNITVAEDPSTRGEKWGRVAAAALGGAAAGLANSTGVNAPARAAAAGFQTGMAQPQQQRQQVEQQATQEQQMQVRNAQKALLQQQIAQNSFNMNAAKVKLSQEEADRFNQNEDYLMSNPNNKVLGTFSNMQDLIDHEGRGPLLQAHANGSLHVETTPDGKVRAYQIDPAWANQMNDKDIHFKRPDYDDKGNMSLKDDVIPAGSMRNGQVSAALEGYTKQITDARAKEAQTQASIAETGERGATTAAIKAKTPAEVAHIHAETAQAYAAAQKDRAAAAVGGQPGNQGPYNPNDANDVMAAKLADGTELEKGIFTRMPAAQKLQLFARAEALSQQRYGKPYDPAVIAQENTFANQAKTQAYMGATRNLLGGSPDVPTGQLDQLLTTAQAAGFGENSAKNEALIKAASNPVAAILLPEKQLNAINAYITARNEAKRSLTTAAGNPLVSGSDSDMKLKQMDASIGAVPTLGNLRSQIASIKQSTAQERNSAMENNRFLKRRYGTPAAAPQPQPQPQPGGGQPPPQQRIVPPGKFAHRDANGVIDGYADDQKGTNHVTF